MSVDEQRAAHRAEFLRYMKESMDRAAGLSPAELSIAYRGVRYPSVLCSPDTFREMEGLEARGEDVLIITYPKCGTNWSIEILHEMLRTLRNEEPTMAQAMLEFGTPGKFEYLNKQPSPRVFASHLNYETVPKTFFEKKTKILVILRNPKDTAVSYYHFSNKNPVLPSYESWEKFFDDYASGNVIYGSYFDYTLGWEKHLDSGNILVLTFEDMKADILRELRKICDFYGYDLTDEQLQMVKDKTTFSSMKEKSSSTHGNMGDVFFRKGEIGDWKSLFTEAQSQAIDALFEKHLAGTKMGNMIDYAKYCTY